MKNQNFLEYGPPLTLSEAKMVMQVAEQKAREHNLAVIIAIVDSAAQLVMLQRMDHAQFGSIQVAVKKAENAVRFKRPTKAFEDALSHGGLGLRLLTIQEICAVEGGVPLLKEGRIVGAIGAAGMLPQQDAQVAQAGAEAFHKTIEG
jgi:glc operon protein GlcG